MAKRRTRKQKETAKHQFTISWEPSTTKARQARNKGHSSITVKGQKKIASTPQKKISSKSKRAYFMAKHGNVASIKQDLLKSIVIASLILCLEVVIYLKWL